MTQQAHKILHIQASPSPDSRSASVARHFLAEHHRHRPGSAHEHLNVWQEPLPAFDAEMIAAKFAVLRARNATPEQQRRWEEARRLSQRFNAADRYVLSVPMWNFGLPYRLKHYIDVVTLAGENWIWTPQRGYEGFLRDKKALLVYTSAGAYPIAPGDAENDFQKGQMRRWLKFLGITEIAEISAAPSLAPPETTAAALEQAKAEAERLALDFF